MIYSLMDLFREKKVEFGQEVNFSEIKMEQENDGEGQGDVLTKNPVKLKPKKPKLFKVLLHNDDYTTMEFVIYVLQSCFSKTLEEAQEIMLKVHHSGVGICGVYTHEIAESKTAKVHQISKKNGHPLRCTFEPE
ncbi:MAG: ATP-dependent Clp protease adapter ClpS [Bdellovibrionota bacterium]|nr:ATP-dependent Clp protease adapter ClpS [Bdellovibrionota bacterium]